MKDYHLCVVLILRNEIMYDDNIMKGILQVFYAFFSSIIMAFAIQNEFLLFGSPVLGLFALVPLYLALADCDSFKKAGLLTALQMLCTHVFTSFWLGNFKDVAVFTLGATTAVYAVFGYFLGGLFFAPFYLTHKDALAERSGLKPFNVPARVLLFAALWTIYEWKKSIGFLAYPWGTLVMSAWKWKLVTQIVDITGTWGISFLFALFNALIAEGLSVFARGGERYSAPFASTGASAYTRGATRVVSFSYARTAAFCLLLFMLACIYGICRYTETRIPVKTVRTVLVQPNFNSWLSEQGENALEDAIELTRDQLNDAQNLVDKPDVILWSESVLPSALPNALTFYEGYPESDPLLPFITENGVPLITGSPVEVTAMGGEERVAGGIREFNNAAVYFDKEGSWRAFYGKIQLVPFAEVIPYADTRWMQTLMQTIAGFSSGWTPGKAFTVFDLPLKAGSVKAGTPICFEDAFPSVCRKLFFAGSEVFFNLTNDEWSKTASAEIQHFAIASYRAQEFRTTLVRCTNAGFTSITDPAGRLLYSLPLFEKTAGTYDVPIYERTVTAYARFGDWLPFLLLFMWAAFYAGTLPIFNAVHVRTRCLRQALLPHRPIRD